MQVGKSPRPFPAMPICVKQRMIRLALENVEAVEVAARVVLVATKLALVEEM